MIEHYFTKTPTSQLKIHTIKPVIKTKEFEFYTASGLFSLNRLDRSSELLITRAIIKENWKVLDLGCGYGIIGIVLKLNNQAIDVTFSDINERAIMITKKNLEKYQLKAKVIQSDIFENIKEEFDTILLNPPQTAGKETCKKMIREAKEHLKKGGLLQIVARHNKGGKTLSNYMKEIYKNMDDKIKHAGIRIYISKKD